MASRDGPDKRECAHKRARGERRRSDAVQRAGQRAFAVSTVTSFSRTMCSRCANTAAGSAYGCAGSNAAGPSVGKTDASPARPPMAPSPATHAAWTRALEVEEVAVENETHCGTHRSATLRRCRLRVAPQQSSAGPPAALGTAAARRGAQAPRLRRCRPCLARCAWSWLRRRLCCLRLWRWRRVPTLMNCVRSAATGSAAPRCAP